MRDARDAEDSRLLAEGEIDLLLSAYVDVVRGRCIAGLRDGLAGEDAAQVVCLRLWKELKQGKHADGRWPFRVIVHKVIDFTCKGWFEPGWIETGWLDVDKPTPDETAAVDAQLDLEAFIECGGGGPPQGPRPAAARDDRALPEAQRRETGSRLLARASRQRAGFLGHLEALEAHSEQFTVGQIAKAARQDGSTRARKRAWWSRTRVSRTA